MVDKIESSRLPRANPTKKRIIIRNIITLQTKLGNRKNPNY